MFKKAKHLSIFRKVALGSWWTAGDPSVYGVVEIEMSHALKHLANLQSKSSEKITPTHLVGKAIAVTLHEHPELNGIIKLGDIYHRQSVDVFFQINIPGEGKDAVKKSMLSGAAVRNAEKLSVAEIAKTLNQKSSELKSNEPGQKRKEFRGELGNSLRTLAWVPPQFMRWILNLTSFLNYDLNINMKWLGMPRDPFGSVMVTNVGSLGIEMAWAPLVPFTRVPLLLTVGEVQDKPFVEQGQLCIRPVMKIGVTLDHRFIDGAHGAAMLQTFKKCFEDPATWLV